MIDCEKQLFAIFIRTHEQRCVAALVCWRVRRIADLIFKNFKIPRGNYYHDRT